MKDAKLKHVKDERINIPVDHEMKRLITKKQAALAEEEGTVPSQADVVRRAIFAYCK